MNMWKSFNINIQNIEHETERAMLINCPNKSEYKGYSFWHPKKLVRSGKHSYALQMSYTEEFKFKLQKYGKQKNILNEIEVDAKQIEEIFATVDENINCKKISKETHVIVNEPIKIKAGKIEADNTLKNE